MVVLLILLKILKIIGIILGGIIGLVLLLLLFVVFSPIRYKGRVVYKDKPDINVKFSYLCHIISGSFVMDGNDKKFVLKIFGHSRKNKKKKTKTKKTKTKKAKTDIKASADRITLNKDNFSYEERRIQAAPEEKAEKDAHKGLFSKVKAVFDKIKKAKSTAKEKVNNILEKKNDIMEQVNDPENRNGLRFLLKILKKLLKHIFPRKYKIYIRFGSGDPATTGEILGVAYAFTIVCGINFVMEPDFDNKVIECDVPFKGKIRLISILYLALRVLKNKDAMQLIKTVRDR